MSADLRSSGKSGFYSSVMRMSGYNNRPDFDPNVLNNSKIKHFISLMKHKYILHWQHTIQRSKKLDFCNTFKNEYTLSCYQELTSKLNERKELVKFRIGNHKLMIETGRYSQMPRVNRLCPTFGSNQIEDEIHLLFHCPKYSIFRDRFYRKKEYHLPNIKRLSTLEATKELMNSVDYYVNIQLMRFILSRLNSRNSLLSIQTDVI